MSTSPTRTVDLADLEDRIVALAQEWSGLTQAGQTRKEAATSHQLSRLLSDHAGLDLAVRFVDRVARPDDLHVAAGELAGLSAGSASFLSLRDRGLLAMGARMARILPWVVVPSARLRLRQLVGHMLVDAEDPTLAKHLAAARAQGFRLNVNLLGELVLGEAEAERRTEKTRALVARPDVDYVSIKISSLVSQISTWDTAGTVERAKERLRPLYRTAAAKSPAAFVNLDMEEYRDLDMTLELFTDLLDEPEFHHLEAGIVLQAYLPDAVGAMEYLIRYSRERVTAGRAPIKVRLVKGANLAMEAVEARIHGWEQAPYATKAGGDANYLRCLDRALSPDVTEPINGVRPLRLGVASHNLFDLAAAFLLAKHRDVLDAIDVEMLQGMAPSQARAIRDAVGTVILYTPVVAKRDFDVAVGYLIRRLEENAEPQNFLHAYFAHDGLHRGDDQESRFRASLQDMATVADSPRRQSERPPIGDVFENTPDSDPALPEMRKWAVESIARPLPKDRLLLLGSNAEVDVAVRTAVDAASQWAARPGAERAAVLRRAARELEDARGALLGVMAAEGGKTVTEADPEISEAIDFARYYADRALDLEQGPAVDGAEFTPDRVVLVTPPWNFPVAIPIGGVLAGLAAGASVIIKPAHSTPLCAQLAVEALHRAGVPSDALQIVRTGDRAVGQRLISHPDIDTVVLTGSTETAELFARWRSNRPNGSRVYGETSGKNAIVVTPAADIDLAVADLVRSAFGHAGQKCSAASLAILVGSVADSERFHRQLVDAVRSLRVDWPSNLGAGMGPIIEPPTGKLYDALTHLQPGEEWVVKPKLLEETPGEEGNGRLWSPGVKKWVRPGSSFHLTEVFGPVLGLMRAKDLDEAIELQNATSFGLTGGLHSLDAEEIFQWTQRVDVGNAYVNRHITGAIVQRQAFGGWKQSSVGPGAKAGGPNYIAQLGQWSETATPTHLAPIDPAPLAVLDAAIAAGLDERDQAWLRVAAGSDAAAWATEFGVEHDESRLVVESNVFCYVALPVLHVCAGEGASPVEVARLAAAAALVDSRIELSTEDGGLAAFARALPGVTVHQEAAGPLADRLRRLTSSRVRVVGKATDLAPLAADPSVGLLPGPVLANGRRELLSVLREQSISRTMHRFGHLSEQSLT